MREGMWYHLLDEIDQEPVTGIQALRRKFYIVVIGYVLCVSKRMEPLPSFITFEVTDVVSG